MSREQIRELPAALVQRRFELAELLERLLRQRRDLRQSGHVEREARRRSVTARIGAGEIRTFPLCVDTSCLQAHATASSRARRA